MPNVSLRAGVLLTGALLAGSALHAYVVPVPSRLDLTVRETAGVPRSGEVLRSGVPIPKSLGLTSTGPLAVVNGAGTAVPAEFKVLGRWDAARDNSAAPIQWVLVSFPASVAANGTANYRLVVDGSVANPAPAQRVTVSQSGNSVTVDTGAATFRLGGNPGAVFDEVILSNGPRLVNGGAMTVRTGGAERGHSTTRRVRIEHSGPLSAVVVVDGVYDMPAVGDGALSSGRRYVFTAGSATAIVRRTATWEGNLACDSCIKTSSGAPNGLKIEQLRDALTLEVTGARSATVIGAANAAPVVAGLGSGSEAWVRQRLRTGRTAPLAYDIKVGGATAAGSRADGALLAVAGTNGTVAVALDHMHRYEPQALRVLADGRIAVDHADDKAWLAHHMGLFSTMAVGALVGQPARGELDRRVWAPLNHPLRAWPSAQWFAASEAVQEIPYTTLSGALASYDSVVRGVLDRTYSQIDNVGLPGLMTFGIYPRYWGENGSNGEVDCKTGQDPTPNESWDNLFWCGFWTDYHNTVATAPIWAMRSGQVEWLDELATPGALRVLHTQIMQCGPGEKWGYCGQAPTGYMGYRSDFNSSHAYFENLFLYYWLSGDETVPEKLRRGGENMRRLWCSQRGSRPVTEPIPAPGPSCTAADVPVSTAYTGRVAYQWQSVYRFLGMTVDPTFLDDYRQGVARELTHTYVEANRNGKAYGFLGELAGTAGTHEAGPIWMNGFYDTQLLWVRQRESNDAPLGSPALPPSRVIQNVARTLDELETTVQGDGTVASDWPKTLTYTYSGNRIGGSLLSTAVGDRPIYDTEKSAIAALMARAGAASGSASLLARARELVALGLSDAAGSSAPLGKIQGQYLSRLHPAVAQLAALEGGAALPTPTPTPGPETEPAPVTSAPLAPTGLTAAVVSSTEVRLTWTDVATNEAEYLVQEADKDYVTVRTLPANSTSVTLSNLQPRSTHRYRVVARNAAGSKASSTVKVTLPQSSPTPTPTPEPAPTPSPSPLGAPTALHATSLSSSQIQLGWTDMSTTEDVFIVQRLWSTTWKEATRVAKNVTTAKVGALTAGTTYKFRVCAKADGVSSCSASLAVVAGAASTTSAATLAAPTQLTVAKSGDGTATLRWRDNAQGETAYRIEQRKGKRFVEVATTTGDRTQAVVKGLRRGRHAFRVRATGGAGRSAYSKRAIVRIP